MSDTTSATGTPLMENEHVKELLSIMKANSLNTKDLQEMFGYVGSMERQLDAAVRELGAMRQELSQMRETQNHPVKTALQNAVHTLETAINEARARLDAVKQGIIDGCKNAVAAFKEKGIAALSNIMSFFKIKPALQALRNNLNQGIKADEKAIASIEAFSVEYHKAGLHVKNMGRALTGQDALEEANPVGKLAKAVEAPLRAEIAILKSARNSVDKAIAKLNGLEIRAEQAEKKPSVLDNLQSLKEQVAQVARNAPMPDKVKKQEVSM